MTDPAPPATRRNPLARRLPLALLVLGVALGFAVGAAFTGSDSSAGGSAAASVDNAEAVANAVSAATTVEPLDDQGFSALSNGHHHTIAWHEQDERTQAELDRQLALARQAAAQYPTLADAVAAGFRPAGGFGPGAGIHYIGGPSGGAGAIGADGTLTDAAILHPDTLLFDGTTPDSKLAGLMYNVSTGVEPVGFVGTNDVWHSHTGLCIVQDANGIHTLLSDEQDQQVKQEKCPEQGGRYIVQTGWMMHVWVAPGYENPPGGYFAEENAFVACSDGTYHATNSVIAQQAHHPENTCVSGAAGHPTAKTLANIGKNLTLQAH
ncbi:MAG: hypothetical protein U0W40_05360 [Acidimicrobiia bacterium]